MKDKLELLKEEAILLQEKQNNCNHEWNNLVEDTTKENITIPVWHGNEIHERIIATRDVKCLSHTCKKCGKKEYMPYENIDIKPNTR